MVESTLQRYTLHDFRWHYEHVLQAMAIQKNEIDPDSCQLMRISNCYISVGDDCIVIKSGTEHEDRDRFTPCRDITITNCTLERGHGGVVIGSEMSGGIRNVVISNCVLIGTDRGIRIKTRRGRGGILEDIRVSNLIMDSVLCPSR